jgi:hypothetical protein
METYKHLASYWPTFLWKATHTPVVWHYSHRNQAFDAVIRFVTLQQKLAFLMAYAEWFQGVGMRKIEAKYCSCMDQNPSWETDELFTRVKIRNTNLMINCHNPEINIMKLTVVQLGKNSLPLEPEALLPCSWEPITGSYLDRWIEPINSRPIFLRSTIRTCPLDLGLQHCFFLKPLL